MIFLYWLLFWLHFPILLFWALFGLLLHSIGRLFKNKELETYGIRVALGADQMGNGFAAGFPDETISSRVGRAIATGRPKAVARFLKVAINGIFFWEENHVIDAIEHDEEFDKRYEPWPWTDWSPRELGKKETVK